MPFVAYPMTFGWSGLPMVSAVAPKERMPSVATDPGLVCPSASTSMRLSVSTAPEPPATTTSLMRWPAMVLSVTVTSLAPSHRYRPAVRSPLGPASVPR